MNEHGINFIITFDSNLFFIENFEQKFNFMTFIYASYINENKKTKTNSEL